VHLSKIESKNIEVVFNVTGSSVEEEFSYGEGILNIDAGLKSSILTIDDIPQDRFSFIQGDRKIIITLIESSNSILGDNLIYTHTLTDDQKAWTDPNVNYFCLTNFDNTRSSELTVARNSLNSKTEDTKPQINDSEISFEDLSSEMNILNRNDELDQADNIQKLEATIDEMININGPVIADIRVEKEENCFPMIPSGAAHNEMILSSDDNVKDTSNEGLALV